MKSNSEKPFRIRVTKNGGVRFDGKKFMERPEVKRQSEILLSIDIEGKKLVGGKLVPIDDNDSARDK